MIYDTLNVAVAPLDITTADRQANLDAVAKIADRLPEDTDLLVLPELFTTSFVADRDTLIDLSETMSGPSVDRLIEIAKKHNMAIAGTIVARIGGALYNRALFIDPTDEEISHYDKSHLFSISKEAELLHSGDRPPRAIRFRGWNIAMIVCYDLRFPCWCRNRQLAYDLMLVPANWPESRRLAWDTLLRARAIENQSYYIGANRSGSDEFGEYPADMTAIVDYLGRPLAIGDAGADVITATLSRPKLEQHREKFPIWKDAD